MFNRVSEVHVYAGFPCVHLSSARAFRQNLAGEGSNLFRVLLDLLSWIHEVFGTFCVVKHCIENVASMDSEAPADCMPFSRPRLAWCSVELAAMEELEFWTEQEYVRAYVTVSDCVPTASWIRPGWQWHGEEEGVKLPAFMKSVRRTRPPPVPAGLARASAETVEMWTQDEYRFYQYRPQYRLHHPELGVRLLDASERELLLGFGPHHTSSCMSASTIKQSKTKFEDVRKSLLGDSFAILSFSIMAAQMCSSLVPRMKPSQILKRLGLAPGVTVHPRVCEPISRWLACGGSAHEDPGQERQLVRHLGLLVNHTGHGSVRAWWWQWKRLFKARWNESAPINLLEMRMILILNTISWKSRSPSKINSRWLRLTDSMVFMCSFKGWDVKSHAAACFRPNRGSPTRFERFSFACSCDLTGEPRRLW